MFFAVNERSVNALIVVVNSLIMIDSYIEEIVRWATILSPIIAVVIAIWTSRSSAKDTAKKIAAIEESTQNQIAALEQSTQKQLKSVKKLARIHTETSQIQINMELSDSMTREKQALKKRWDVIEREYGFNGQPVEIGVAGDFYRNREEKEKNLEYEGEFYAKRRQMLMNYQKRLNELSKELEEM